MAEDKAVINLGCWGKGSFARMTYTSPTTPGRVALNLKSGNDIALHCNPRYDQQALVLNSNVSGQWGTEERPPCFPLGHGQHTQIVAVVKDQSIDIFANKRTFSHQYRHRYDANRVNQIHCNGNGTPVQAWVGRALYQYEVGKVVYIKGTAPTGKVFTIDFVPSLPYDYKSENIAFHMSFRFNENCVVRNSKNNEQWGQEERAGGMPVQPGQAFNIVVVAQKEGYEVGVNGAHFCKFRHRVPLNKEMSVQVKNVPYVERIDYD